MANSIASPYSIDGRGRTATSDPATLLRDLIESVLFTSPSERVMRPTFGCGLQRLVFAPNSDQLAATLKVLATTALTQWLGDLIEVADVQVDNQDSTLFIAVSYVVRSTNETADVSFQRTL
jgi:phage baseplate assembly protein W